MVQRYTKKIQITLEENDFRKIEKLAEIEEIPISIYMRKFVKKWLNNDKV